MESSGYDSCSSGCGAWENDGKPSVIDVFVDTGVV